jgi:hypothetical protein
MKKNDRYLLVTVYHSLALFGLSLVDREREWFQNITTGFSLIPPFASMPPSFLFLSDGLPFPLAALGFQRRGHKDVLCPTLSPHGFLI